ncbi:MAG: VOC family protein [Acidobacteriota bacterium]
MTTRTIGGALLLLPVALLLGLQQSPRPARDAHGTFTGDIKPVLYVSDVEASAAFFEETLGFGLEGFSDRSDGSPYYAEMTAGDRKFGLHEPTQPGQGSRVGEARLYFRVLDLEAHRERLAGRGAEPSEILETDWMDMCIVRDPDGHEIVFAVTDPDRHGMDPW